jgi:hypothetical protein
MVNPKSYVTAKIGIFYGENDDEPLDFGEKRKRGGTSGVPHS